MTAPAFDAATQANYAALWQRMSITPGREASLQTVARKIIGYKARYLKIEKQLGIPWWWVGITHYREADCNFHCHLHNGDPLSARTTHVPAGRPKSPSNPPFTWEESAVDALTMEGLENTPMWCITRAAYAWEAYNGWGYERLGVTSAYLWAGTTDHAKGKYTSDGHYSPEAVDQELGTMPLLQAIMAMDPSVKPAMTPKNAQSGPVVRPPEVPASRGSPEPTPAPEPSQGHRTPWAVLVGTVTSVCTALGQAVDAVRPLLADPKVIAVVIAIISVAAVVILLEHVKHTQALAK